MVQDNRPSAYYEGDHLIVRASAIGGCLWELIACAQGYDQGRLPQSLVKAFAEGHELEPKALSMIKDAGWELYDEQKEGLLQITDNCSIRYHPDSLGTHPSSLDKYVVEVKWFGEALFKKAMRHGVGSTIAEYNWQISSMMYGEELPGMWVIGNKDANLFSEQLYWEAVPEPPITLDRIVNKVNSLLGAIDDDLMTRPCDEPKHWPCRFLALRPEPEAVEETLFVGEVGLDEEFNQLAKEHVYLKGQENELKARRKMVDDRLKELAGNFRRVQSDRWKVWVKKGKNVHANRDAIARDKMEDKYLASTEFDYIDAKGLE